LNSPALPPFLREFDNLPCDSSLSPGFSSRRGVLNRVCVSRGYLRGEFSQRDLAVILEDEDDKNADCAPCRVIYRDRDVIGGIAICCIRESPRFLASESAESFVQRRFYDQPRLPVRRLSDSANSRRASEESRASPFLFAAPLVRWSNLGHPREKGSEAARHRDTPRYHLCNSRD